MHTAASVTTSSFLKPNSGFVCTVCILLVHPPVTGYLGCQHHFAAVNDLAVNVGVLESLFSILKIHGSGITGSYVLHIYFLAAALYKSALNTMLLVFHRIQ